MFYLNVNRNVLAANKARGENEAPVSYRWGRSGPSAYAHRIEVLGQSVFVHDEEHPLPCGARVWIETPGPLRVDGKLITRTTFVPAKKQKCCK